MFMFKSTHEKLVEELENDHKIAIGKLENQLKVSEAENTRLTNILSHFGTPENILGADPDEEKKDIDLARIDDMIKLARNWSPIRMSDRATKRKTLVDLANEREKILRKIESGKETAEAPA